MRLLIVEDERALAASLTKGLREEGFAVDCAHDGEHGLFLAETGEYDLLIIDWMLPKISGQELIQRLRESSAVPVLMLTAKGTVNDRVAGLSAGADDYLVKPFAFAELIARIRALLRRPAQAVPTTLTVGDLILDPTTKTATRAGAPLKLSRKEYLLLEVLLRHAGQVMSREELLAHVWDHEYEGFSNVVDVYIRYLRQKVDKPYAMSLIHTVRGFGYKIEPSEQRQ